LNMNQLLVPSGIGLFEHYCRRWLSVKLLQESVAISMSRSAEEMPIGVQLSEFLESQDLFLSIGFARQLVLSPDIYSSVVVGFRVDSNLKHTIRFMEDPAIPRIIISETCERCPLLENQCQMRAAAPTILVEREQKRALKLSIDMLRDR